MNTSPPSIWRAHQKLSQWLGKKGTVVHATRVYVAPVGLEAFVPYSYALVDFVSERAEFMVEGSAEVEEGDAVECVVRRQSQVANSEVLAYGIKVKKIESK